MFRSLFLFDVTFWLYLAAVVLYFGYLVASKKALRPAYAGHPVSSEEDDGWTQPLGQLATRSEEHTSELQSRLHLVCRLLLEKKKRRQERSYLPCSPSITRIELLCIVR